MQITEKIRKAILFALTELPEKEAEKIASVNGVTTVTVYRYWKKIKTNEPVEANNITLAIAELAATKKPEVEESHKRWAKIQKQLSAT